MTKSDTVAPARIPDARWLNDPPLAVVFAALNRDGDSVRVVGGAVRDALLGRPFSEVDLATTAEPAIVEARAKAAGIRTAPTGIDHGTVSLIVEGRSFQVTTLRQDVETDGRRAVVKFGRDWTADALRRDFTMNALSVEADGTLHDPVGGYADLMARRIRFIGDPDARVAEDHLRILRFFRFHAEFGTDAPDGAGLGAAIRGRRDLTRLSAERIGQEMRKLLVAPGAVATLIAMQDAGVLPIVLGGISYPGVLARLIAVEPRASVALRLAAAACRIDEDARRLTDRFRLSNGERDSMLAAIANARRFAVPPAGHDARALLYRLGTAGFTGAVMLAAAWSTGPVSIWRDALSLPARWKPPTFPLSGGDLLAAGMRAGPDLGAVLKDLEAWWITEDFTPDKSVLLNRFQQRIAATQQ